VLLVATILALGLGRASIASAQVQFSTTGGLRIVRAEGRTEVVSAVDLVAQAGANSIADGTVITIVYDSDITNNFTEVDADSIEPIDLIECEEDAGSGLCDAITPDNVAVDGPNLFIRINGTGVEQNDRITVSGVRLDAASVGPGDIRAVINSSGDPAGQRVTFTNPVVLVARARQSLDITITPSESNLLLCDPPEEATTTVTFSVQVEEQFPSVFTSEQQERESGIEDDLDADINQGLEIRFRLTGVNAALTLEATLDVDNGEGGDFPDLAVAISDDGEIVSEGEEVDFTLSFDDTDLGQSEDFTIDFTVYLEAGNNLVRQPGPVNLSVRMDPVGDFDEEDSEILLFADNGSALDVFSALDCPSDGPSGGGSRPPPPEPPSILLRPGELSFTVFEGKNPGPQSFEVVNRGDEVLNWTASITSNTGGNWLSLSPASGSDNGRVAVTVNSASLAGGAYSATVSVSSPDAANSPQTLTVSLTVAPKPDLVLSPPSLTFSGSPGSNPAPQQLTVSSSEGEFYWSGTVSTSSGGDWLSLSRTTPFLSTPGTVAVNTAGLAAGTYQGTITITAPDAANTSQTVSVTLILGAPEISLQPGSLVFVTSSGRNPTPQTLEVLNSGLDVLGWTASVATESGENWLSVGPETATAPSTLTVTVSSAAGAYTGTITIAALPGVAASNSPQVVTVGLAVDAPAINPDGVVNAATFSEEAVVSPGSIASLFGTNLAITTAAASLVREPGYRLEETRANPALRLPTFLENTQVLVNELPAPLFFVSPAQINFQMPPGLSGPTVQLRVVSAGVRGPAASVKIASEMPGIFTVNSRGTGQGSVLIANTEVLAAPLGGFPGRATQPVNRGGFILIFCTGLGATNPPLAAGQAAGIAPLSETVQSPVVLIDGLPAEVQFSGLAPDFVGLYQVNARVPEETRASDTVPLQIQIGGQTSNTVTIAVQ